MIRLYSSGGSQEIDLVDQRMRAEVWARLRETAARLLSRRGNERAAQLLRNTPFEVWAGTNGFGDEFSLLYASLPLDEYIALADMEHDEAARAQFRQIANALAETDVHIRFIAAALDEHAEAEPAGVAAPALVTTSQTLERALAEVERSLAAGEPATGVDRVHTAFHAYLRELAAGIGRDDGEAGIVELFRLLRQAHPALQPTGPRAADVTRILNAMATVVDALNPLRNRATLAHPVDGLLADPEAMLVINTVRTLLHYFEKRLRAPVP